MILPFLTLINIVSSCIILTKKNNIHTHTHTHSMDQDNFSHLIISHYNIIINSSTNK